MKIAHDLFSETNPAYCACALVGFTAAYSRINSDGPELPVAYLALPIALSGDLATTFERTNKNTGLLEWLERNPQVQVGLTERLNASMDFVTEAVRFGCFSHVLAMNESARLGLGARKIKGTATASLSDNSTRSLKCSQRLGSWFAAAGSTKTVFDMMGLTV